jgi:hypothetical protein
VGAQCGAGVDAVTGDDRPAVRQPHDGGLSAVFAHVQRRLSHQRLVEQPLRVWQGQPAGQELGTVYRGGIAVRHRLLCSTASGGAIARAVP